MSHIWHSCGFFSNILLDCAIFSINILDIRFFFSQSFGCWFTTIIKDIWRYRYGYRFKIRQYRRILFMHMINMVPWSAILSWRETATMNGLWRCSNFLRAKRKIWFIDGRFQNPIYGSNNLEYWLSINSMIIGWIRSFMDLKVWSTVTFISNAHKLWENLKKSFSIGNKVWVHHLKSQLAACR